MVSCLVNIAVRNRRARLRTCACFVLFMVLRDPSAARGQTFWEMTPYRVEVVVALDRVPELSGYVATDLISGLRESVNSIIGSHWTADVRTVDPLLRHQILTAIDTLTMSDITPEQLDRDKVIVMGVRNTPGQFVIQAREFDCQTRRWGVTTTVEVGQAEALGDALFHALRKVFTPIATVEFDDQHRPVLNLRARERPQGDPELTWCQPGDVFIPIVRRNDRDGNPTENGIQQVPWTYLMVDQIAEQPVCEVFSGTRNPFSVRRRGRTEQYALATHRPRRPTRLKLQSRSEPVVPLAGYEFYTSKPGEKKTQPVGITDRNGGITIPPADEALQVLFVKSGGQVLAKLPLVAGLESVVEVPVSDDDPRLLAEGQLKGLREKLVDLVARRQILIARIRRAAENGDRDRVEVYLDELERLPTRKPFTQQIDQLQTASVSSDPRVKAQIDRMFADTRNMLAKFLDPREITDLRSQLNVAKQGGQ